jgi:hypothetical protein
MALLYAGRAGRLTAHNGGFWRGQLPSVLTAIGCKGTSGLPEYCITQWLPTIFVEEFGLSMVQVGLYRVWVSPVMFATDWVVGAIEDILLHRGHDQQQLRRVFTVVGGSMEWVALAGFALSRTPGMAAFFNVAVWSSYTLHHSGWSANLLEVGGKDTPVMNAISNILNNAPGFLIPPVGLIRCAG